MRLRDKIMKSQRPVVVYEIIPPRIVDGSVESYAERISSLLSQTHIDAINIPEVHAEETRGKRPIEERERAEPREFGRIIQDSVGVEAIVNRVTVLQTRDSQREWFETTLEEYGIENIILVGGESGKINYPGPNVVESAEMIGEINKCEGATLFVGGISLPSRAVESKRMLSKSNVGVEFFTTQVLYQSDDIKKMLGHYQRISEDSGREPKRVLLSFAPISTKKNLEFLKWLGVEIDQETEDFLLEDPEKIKERSIKICLQILDEILEYVSTQNISVPIGLNVEHIMSYNFQYSVELLQKMSKRYRSFCLESSLYNLTG